MAGDTDREFRGKQTEDANYIATCNWAKNILNLKLVHCMVVVRVWLQKGAQASSRNMTRSAIYIYSWHAKVLALLFNIPPGFLTDDQAFRIALIWIQVGCIVLDV